MTNTPSSEEAKTASRNTPLPGAGAGSLPAPARVPPRLKRGPRLCVYAAVFFYQPLREPAVRGYGAALEPHRLRLPRPVHPFLDGLGTLPFFPPGKLLEPHGRHIAVYVYAVE